MATTILATVDPFGGKWTAEDRAEYTAWADATDSARAAELEAIGDREREQRERDGNGFEDEGGCDGFPW